jgi:hypothetical protein
MPIIVACSCGQSFQTKDEYLGKTGRCPACKQPILIQPAVVAPVAPVAHAAGAQAYAQPEAYADEAPVEEEVNPRAAKILKARQQQAAADRKFAIRLALIAGGIVVVGCMAWTISFLVATSNMPPIEEQVKEKENKVEAKSTAPAVAATDPQPQKAVTPPTEPVPAEPVKARPDYSNFKVNNDIDAYVLLALKTGDRHTRINAKIFRPDEPLLDFTPEERPVSEEGVQRVKDLLAKLASTMDLDLGPNPNEKSDLIEARMLLDADLVGNGLWLATQGGRNNYLVFVELPKSRMAQVTSKYGEPAKTLRSNELNLHFFGRIVLMEKDDGSIVGVARRITRIAKLSDEEAQKDAAKADGK